MSFCINCGQEIKDGAKFCYNCGSAVYTAKKEEKDKTKRRTVYDGEIHKCPNCGEVINSFEAKCSSCGWEIRSTQSADAVRKLAEKLERIEARQMPHIEEKKSVMKMVFGRDFKEKDEVQEAKYDFEKQKEEEKANLISNFPVPNTKEDILEFMLLASLNINLKKGIDDVVSKAWLAKLDQVYKRAEITLRNAPDFTQIKEIYDAKKHEIKSKRRKAVLGWTCGVAGYFFFMGLLLNPVATIGITVGVLVIILIGFIIFKKR